MRIICHLSDLHFGRVDERLLDPLVQTVQQLNPDLVAVSGDLTQRARSHQFREARSFLDRLPQPQIVVPGNHDVPLHNIFSRFLQPLDKYREFITDELQPFYGDDEIAVVGINTARSLTVKGGRINHRQISSVREKLCPYPDEVVKVVVTHHPFDLPEGFSSSDLVGRAHLAMNTLAECGADLFLAGHLHISHTGHTATRYKIHGHSALVVQAGTATSTRGRGEANSFNVIKLDHPEISVERMVWQPEERVFISSAIERFRHTDNGWEKSDKL